MPSDFEFEGFNDKPKPCPKCEAGLVRPTWNCNVGKCDKCGESTGWDRLTDIEGIEE